MCMLTVTASESLVPRVAEKPLAPTLANAIAMIGTPKRQTAPPPSVSVATYASLPDLYRSLKAIDDRCDRYVGVAIELPVGLDPDWRQLSRSANPGGRLALVIPPGSPAGAILTRGELEAEIAGWDEVRACASIDEAMRRTLRGGGVIKRCFALRPEERDPAPVLQAIGRHLSA